MIDLFLQSSFKQTYVISWLQCLDHEDYCTDNTVINYSIKQAIGRATVGSRTFDNFSCVD